MASVNRRNLLKAAGLTTATAAASHLIAGGGTAEAFFDLRPGRLPKPNYSPLIFHSPRVRPFIEELRPMPIWRGENFVLPAETHRHRFHPEYEPSLTFGYGGATYLSPLIETHRDAPVSLRLQNRIGTNVFAKDVDPTLHGTGEIDRTRVRTVLHLHGGVQSPRNDGHMEATILPGEDFTYYFPMRQRASNAWFHCHAGGVTRLNVYAGLAGMMWIRDRWDTGRPDNPLGLPTGRYELPLVLQEKIFTRRGQQSIRSTPLVPQGSWEGGAVGDVGLVNGQVWPRIPVDRGRYRLRIINAASFSGWRLFFSNKMPFWVIGNDGGLLDAPVPTNYVDLTPAERVDILVDFSRLRPGEKVELRNNEKPPMQAVILGEVTMPVFCRFEATSTRGHRGPVPATLRGGPNQPAKLPPVIVPRRVRNLTINQRLELRIPPAMMTLNNQTYGDDDIEKPVQGTTEVWNFINITDDPHPMHVHLVNFRILGRQPINSNAYKRANPIPKLGIKWRPSAEPFVTGPMVPPAPWEAGWKETVRAPAHSITRVVIYFPTADELGFDPDETFVPPHPQPDSHGATHTPQQPGTEPNRIGGYMWHCHILDHEDHDMMLGFRTVAP